MIESPTAELCASLMTAVAQFRQASSPGHSMPLYLRFEAHSWNRDEMCRQEIMITEAAVECHPPLTTLEEEPQGLLVVGGRNISPENGYGQGLLREHRGCQACAQRCSACAQRYHGIV